MRNAITAVLVAGLAILSPIAHAKKVLTKDRVEVQTEYGPVILQNVSVQQGETGVLVSGTATNQSSRAWRYISFVLSFRDKSGKSLDEGGLFNEVQVAGLGKGETKPLSSITGDVPAELLISLNRKTEDFDIKWYKEHSFYDSRTVFALTTPTQNKALEFEDDSIGIALEVGNEQLGFTLKNKTQEPQTINWDEVSFVDLSGTAHRVLHQGVKLVDRDKPQSPTIIPPGAKISDLVEPSDSVKYDDTINDWTHEPLLPPSQLIVNFKGKTFAVFMPILVNGKKKNYTFTIRIDDVQM